MSLVILSPVCGPHNGGGYQSALLGFHRGGRISRGVSVPVEFWPCLVRPLAEGCQAKKGLPWGHSWNSYILAPLMPLYLEF